jgi:pilus assembly protein CpaC
MNAQFATGAPRLLSPARASAIAMAVAVTVGQVHAQNLQPVAHNSDTGAVNAAASDTATSEVQLLVGRSTLLNVGNSITRVSLTSPNVADAMVTTPSQLLIHGKAPGTISMFVWDRAGGIKRYEVVVRRDLSQLGEQMKQLFPGEPISIHSNGKDVVISGIVTSKYVVDKAADVAAGYVEKKDDVVNLLRQQEGVATNQVLLRVRFAEVSRSAMSELGTSIFANGTDHGRWYGRTTTDAVPGPTFDEGKLIFSDFLNLFLFDAKNQIGGVIRALQNKGLFQSLAEPNLIAENGKEASFLAGGEYPYPVVQGGSDRNSVTIQFKEFGVRLNFTPTIVGDDLVKIKVRPEVSSLDFSNALTLEGFRVPAISTRRTETEVELQDGQTFAIAGLMNNTLTSQMQKIPGIGDIPILGLLFRSKAAQKNQTELVVMITPTILRRGSTGVSPKLPNLIEPFMPPASKTLPSPAPWNPAASGQAAVQPTVQPAAQPASQPAAQPSAPRVSRPALAEQQAPIQAEPVVQATPAPTPVQKSQPAPQVKTASVAAPVKPAKVDKAAAERARKADEERQKQALKDVMAVKKKVEQQAKAAQEQQEKEAKVTQQRSEEDRKRAAKATKEQARLQAELDRQAADAAKRQAEQDKKQAVIDRKKNEEIAEAQARLDQARKAYEAEVSKINAQNQAPQ